MARQLALGVLVLPAQHLRADTAAAPPRVHHAGAIDVHMLVLRRMHQDACHGDKFAVGGEAESRVKLRIDM